MDEFEKIQKLIRLKQYESPGEEFVDDFIASFRERQRAEMLKQSALSLFWEQVKMHFSEAPGQKWALAAAAIAVLITGAWLVTPYGRASANGVAAIDYAATHPKAVTLGTDPTGQSAPGFSVEAVRIMADFDVEPDPGLLSKHFQSGFEQFLLVPHDNSESTIAVPYELIRFEGRPDIR